MILSYLSMFLTLRIIIYERPTLVRLLEGNRAHDWMPKIVFILLSLLTIVVYIWLATVFYFRRSYNQCLTFIFYLHRLLVRIFLIFIYLETLSVLEYQCRFLLALSRGGGNKVHNLIVHKWLIRSAITALNKLFALPLVFTYLQFVIGSVILINRGIAGKMRLRLWIYAASIGCLLAMTYMMACRCVRIVNILIDVERQVLRQLGSYHWFDGMPFAIKQPPQTYSLYQWKILCFDEKWDSLRIGFFVHGQQTFASFLATCVTSLAVIMQFDYKVISVVNNLAWEYGGGTLVE